MGIQNNRRTNNRRSSEWYTCDRCGFQYPREKVLNQNGLTLCVGSSTTNCADAPGHEAARRKLILPLEEHPTPLPNEDIDL